MGSQRPPLACPDDVPRTPWFVWTSLAAVTCILVGAYWDISWHMTIGRDSFWTPAHLAIQAGGIIGGISGTYLILTTTFRRGTGITVWGFRGPLGAFLGVWGAATMLVSAPFDNWWHNAYGLDVKILSPPHVVLTTGILGVASGSVLVVLSAMNRASGAARARFRTVMLLVGGQILVLAMTSILEMTFRANLHRAEAYRAMAVVVPLVVLALAHASGSRWGATAIATTYMLFMMIALWVFPLFSAEPKLGPVYQHITHFIPVEFPPLVIVPAVVFDLLRAPLTRWPRALQALVLGPACVISLVVVQWPFATFLQSPASRNWIFGTDYFAYFMQPQWYGPRHVFVPDDRFGPVIAEAFVAAVITAWLGLVIGESCPDPTGDDATWSGTPLQATETAISNLPEGGHMIWDRPPVLRANAAMTFGFRVVDRDDHPAADLEPYMGMMAHAEIVRDDMTVFAHVHPDGSIAMPALELAREGLGQPAMMDMPDMPGMANAPHPSPSKLAFPYGFPKPGSYRIFVQIKQAGRIETAAFDAHVE